jgi:Ca2+-binding RTX toxin-like protein
MRRNKLNSIRRFERLEDRQMMAADISLDNGVLTLQGTGNADEIAIEVNSADPGELLVTITDMQNNVVLQQEHFDLDDVQEIVAYGYAGVDHLQNFTDIPAQFFGGEGGDNLFSSGGNDLLDGGAGDDVLIAGGGNDIQIGGAGNDLYYFFSHSGTQLGSDVVYENDSFDTDTLNFEAMARGVNINLASTAVQVVNSDLTLQLSSATGIENVRGTLYGDTIRGNSRNNRIDGMAGDDWAYGEAGDDDLYGVSGNDHLFGGAGNDDLFGDYGNDQLYGEAGLDNLDGGADSDYLDGGYDFQKDRLKGVAGPDTFVRHRNRWGLYQFAEEELLDYTSAVDTVMSMWH